MKGSRLVVGLAAVGLTAGLNFVNAGAVGGGGSLPTWWGKYQVVSSAGFQEKAASSSSSVTVGTNVDVSNEAGPQSETSIAIDPTNSSRIVAGSNEIFRLPMRGYFSSDGGQTWGGVDLPLPPPIAKNGNRFGSDPGVAWDTLGNVYYSYIVVFFGGGFNNGKTGHSINGTEVAVARSSDGGKSWTPTYFDPETGTAQFDDKPMITVDTNPSSPNLNTIYVGWDHSGGKASSSNAVALARSTDHGQSFSVINATPTNNGPANDIGADPFTSPDGTLHVAYNDYLHSQIQVVSSTDGGQSFSAPVTIASDQIGFDIGIPAQNSRRVLEYPACGADASGRLFCSYIDGGVTSGVDVFVASSTDNGAHWGSAVRASDSSTSSAADHFNQWLSVDPSDGSVNVSFYDTRNDPSRVKTDIYLARSTNGGTSFAPNLKVTTAMSDETIASADAGNQYGDYEGISALNGSIHPVWTDGRLDPTLGEEVFSATLTVSATNPKH